MGKTDRAITILDSYDEIINVCVINYEKGIISFVIADNKYLLFCPKEDVPEDWAAIWICSESLKILPHYSCFTLHTQESETLQQTLLDGEYRSLCLYEKSDVVISLFTYEEKIKDIIERLLELIHMPKEVIKHEFQKEFMVYWNKAASDKSVDVYVGDGSSFSRLNYYTGKNCDRCVKPGVILSDKDRVLENRQKEWKHLPDIEAFYIPICDIRDILPPTDSDKWTIQNVVDLVYGSTISHISTETYEALKKEKIRHNRVLTFFGMEVEGISITFAVSLLFSGQQQKSLFSAIIENLVSMELIHCDRLDYTYLSEIIGNDNACIDNNVLLIGAGSLGSYVCTELAKNGCRHITVCDADTLSSENTMRWALTGVARNVPKSMALKMFMEYFHPEVVIDALIKYIDADNIGEYMDKSDMVILTVGLSDVQLGINRVLKERMFEKPVFFVWVEAGGECSHIMKVDYRDSGCFECLYTDDDGNWINNSANVLTDIRRNQLIIRNGCGGTRAPYGTAVLLRTTGALLEAIRKTNLGELVGSWLIDITQNEVLFSKYEGKIRCRRCGNRNEKM